MPINIIVVEDDKDVRETLYEIINSEPDLNCIATFPNAEEFIHAFSHLKADVVMMDIHLPGQNGIQTVAKLKEANTKVQFLMCTSFDDPKRTFDSLAAGANGYILKNSSADKLKEAIRDIYKGGSPMSPEIARLVVDSFRKEQKPNELLSSFNPREQEILKMLSGGFQYKEIADKLNLSVETIRTYIRNIYEVLQVHSRTDAVNKVFH
jgi:DNA-binding NarL/FixJ family response regulator